MQLVHLQMHISCCTCVCICPPVDLLHLCRVAMPAYLFHLYLCKHLYSYITPATLRTSTSSSLCKFYFMFAFDLITARKTWKHCNSNWITITKTIKSAWISKWASSKERPWHLLLVEPANDLLGAPASTSTSPPNGCSTTSHNLHQLMLLYHWSICWEMSWGVKQAQPFKSSWWWNILNE